MTQIQVIREAFRVSGRAKVTLKGRQIALDELNNDLQYAKDAGEPIAEIERKIFQKKIDIQDSEAIIKSQEDIIYADQWAPKTRG